MGLNYFIGLSSKCLSIYRKSPLPDRTTGQFIVLLFCFFIYVIFLLVLLFYCFIYLITTNPGYPPDVLFLEIGELGVFYLFLSIRFFGVDCCMPDA